MTLVFFFPFTLTISYAINDNLILFLKYLHSDIGIHNEITNLMSWQSWPGIFEVDTLI